MVRRHATGSAPVKWCARLVFGGGRWGGRRVLIQIGPEIPADSRRALGGAPRTKSASPKREPRAPR